MLTLTFKYTILLVCKYTEISFLNLNLNDMIVKINYEKKTVPLQKDLSWFHLSSILHMTCHCEWGNVVRNWTHLRHPINPINGYWLRVRYGYTSTGCEYDTGTQSGRSSTPDVEGGQKLNSLKTPHRPDKRILVASAIRVHEYWLRVRYGYTIRSKLNTRCGRSSSFGRPSRSGDTGCWQNSFVH